jgi:hypothetical protein
MLPTPVEIEYYMRIFPDSGKVERSNIRSRMRKWGLEHLLPEKKRRNKKCLE